MHCRSICPRESSSCDEASPGVIEGEEDICRAFFPSDRNKTRVKPSAIRARQLWDGQLSVWRVSDRANSTIEQIVTFIDPLVVRKDGEQFNILGAVRASDIRAHQIEGADERSFSVLDECDYDDQGGKHPAHAHIAICEHLKAKIDFKDDTFLALQEGLILLFNPGRPIWQR